MSKLLLILIPVLWSTVVHSSIPLDSIPFLFKQVHRYIYTWSPLSGQGAWQLLKGDESYFSSNTQLPPQTLEVMALKWRNHKNKTSSQMCVRRFGKEIAVLEETDKKDTIELSYIGQHGMFDCFQINFYRDMGEVLVSVLHGHFEPSLTQKSVTQKSVDSNGDDTEALFSIDLYSRVHWLNQGKSNQNTTTGGYSPDNSESSTVTTSVGSGSGGGGGDDDTSRKPGRWFYEPEIDVMIGPSFYEPMLTVAPALGSLNLATSISISIVADGATYLLHLTREEWKMLVERNLHRSPFLLLRLARHQAAARFDRLLLIKELDEALSHGGHGDGDSAQKIIALLDEHDQTPPDTIHVHSWLAATCLHFILQETGVQLTPSVHEQSDPAEYLKQLDKLIQLLIQSRKLQQAIAETGNETGSGNEVEPDYGDDSVLEQPATIEVFLESVTQQIAGQWKKLLSQNLASIERASVNPTPTLIQASTEGTSTEGTSTIADTAAASSASVTSSTVQATSMGNGGSMGNSGKGNQENENSNSGGKVPPTGVFTQKMLADQMFSSFVKLEVIQKYGHSDSTRGVGFGTGFVVDAEKGIILTNKHVGTAAPVIARAVFGFGSNRQERVTVKPLYSDPVSDFGFYQYDPEELKHTKAQSLLLNTDSATLAMEIWVMGYVNGLEGGISIVKGALSSLHEPMGINSFYYLARLFGSPGSSGSPVLNLKGEVVAILTSIVEGGGKNYLLPVRQVKKALDSIRADRQVPRGSILTKFSFKTWDKLEEARMSDYQQRIVKSNQSECRGLLVVHKSIPESSASERLNSGDIVLKINGDVACDYDTLVDHMDNNVGETIELEIERDQQILQVTMPVRDAHAMSVSKIFTIAGGVFYNVDYRTALIREVPLKGIYVEAMGVYNANTRIPQGSIIYSLNNNEVPDIESFVKEILKPSNRNYKTIIYSKPGMTEVRLSTHIMVNQPFLPPVMYERRYQHKYWNIEHLPTVFDEKKWPDFQRPDVQWPDIQWKDDEKTVSTVNSHGKELTKKSFVTATLVPPFGISMVRSRHVTMTGIVVDGKQGLVLADSKAIKTPLFDVHLVFFGTTEIPARVIMRHPKLDMVLLKYNPDLLNRTVPSVEFVETQLKEGQKVKIVGLNGSLDLDFEKRCLNRVDEDFCHLFAESFSAGKDHENSKKNNICKKAFRTPAPDCTGVIVARDVDNNIGVSFSGNVVYGPRINEFIHAAREKHSSYTDLGVGVYHVNTIDAVRSGVPDKWIESKPDHDASFLEVFDIDRVSSAFKILQRGDLILAIDDNVVQKSSELNALIQDKSKVKVTFCRSGAIHNVDVETVGYPYKYFSQFVRWQGMDLHAPEYPFRRMNDLECGSVMIANVDSGSPAGMAGARYGYCITAVNDKEILTLDEFLREIDRAKPDEIVILNISHLPTRNKAKLSVRPDYTYFPIEEYTQDDEGNWKKMR